MAAALWRAAGLFCLCFSWEAGRVLLLGNRAKPCDRRLLGKERDLPVIEFRLLALALRRNEVFGSEEKAFFAKRIDYGGGVFLFTGRWA